MFSKKKANFLLHSCSLHDLKDETEDSKRDHDHDSPDEDKHHRFDDFG